MGAGEEEATQAIAVLFVFLFNPNYCVGDGTKIYLGKQNPLESLVRVLNGVERGGKKVTSDKSEGGYIGLIESS